MSATCHRCGAFDPAGDIFRSESLPFRGTRVYCPECHAKLEEKFLLGFQAIIFGFGLFGFIFLFLDRSSTVGHVWMNLFLVQLIILISIVFHELAHAIVGKLAGLSIWKIWIGRGKTLYRADLFSFSTEFKMIPIGGLTFLTHTTKDKLRLRYFLAIFAGPLANGIILIAAWKFTSWKDFDIETSIPLGALTVLTQSWILIENLLPYRMQTAVGRLNTDGLSLFQLLASKTPDVLNSQSRVHVSNSSTNTQTSTR